MLFGFFLTFALSEEGIYNFRLSNQLKYLSSFGFRNNSNFSYTIYSSTPIKFNFFLLSSSEFQSPTKQFIYRSCNKSKIMISKINQTYITYEDHFTWNGNVKKQDVYYPTILLCSQNSTNLEIHYKYENNFILTDFRNDSNSTIYLIYTFINLFFSLIWFFNTICQSKFSIPIQQLLMLLPAVNSVFNSFSAFKWQRLQYKSSLSLIERYFSYLITTAFYVLFMTSVTFCLSGWCILRRTLKNGEILSIILSSLMIVFSFIVDTSTFSIEIIKIVGIFWYIKINVEYLTVIVYLAGWNNDRDNLKKRVQMVQNFSFSALLLVFFAMTLEYCAYYIGMLEIITQSILQVMAIFVEALMVCYFAVRDEHRGDELEMDCDSRLKLPVLLEEPGRKQVVLLDQEIDEKCDL